MRTASPPSPQSGQFGISSFNIELTKQAIAAVGEGEIATPPIELSPYLQARKLTAFLKAPSIAVTSSMTLADGMVLKGPVLDRIADQQRATVAQVAPVWDGSGHKGWLTPPWRPKLSPASG